MDIHERKFIPTGPMTLYHILDCAGVEKWNAMNATAREAYIQDLIRKNSNAEITPDEVEIRGPTRNLIFRQSLR